MHSLVPLVCSCSLCVQYLSYLGEDFFAEGAKFVQKSKHFHLLLPNTNSPPAKAKQKINVH
jgi:hypothetical protein